MKYFVAAFVSALMLSAGITLAGAGHGWVSGGYGCFVLAIVSYFAWSNALKAQPSRRIAASTLYSGILICGVVALATAFEGTHYLTNYLHFNGAVGILITIFAYANWLFMSALALYRAPSSLPLGT